jgi:hypothetical protein
MKNIFLFFLAAVVTAFTFTSCKKDNPENTEVSVTFVMEHVVGNEDVVFNDIRYTNTFGNNYSVATLKYFISDIRLTCDCGSVVDFDLEHYVDGMDESTLSFTPSTKVPVGNYNSISFIFGLSEEKNVDNRFPDPPENGMEWPAPLGGGYHYMKLEGKVEVTGGNPNNFQAHTGPTNGNPYFIEVVLPSSEFTVVDGDLILTIRMDINKWWESPNTLDLNQVSSIMGNESAQQLLKENGGDVFSLGPVYSP